MLSLHFQELNTKRLWLRKLMPDDIPTFYESLGSSEAVTRYMLWKPHRSVEESVQSIQKAIRRYETGESFRWAIISKDNNELIGIIDLLPRDIPHGVCSFAYMLAEPFWNQGYGTEALSAVIDFAFRDWGAEMIQADHFAENGASGAVMRKAGMVFRHTLAGKYEKDGQIHDSHVYCITRHQWQMRSKESHSDNS